MLLSSAVCMEWPIVGRVRYARVDGCTTEQACQGDDVGDLSAVLLASDLTPLVLG